MSFFVLTYGRDFPPKIEKFEDGDIAAERLAVLEARFRDNPRCGVVLLFARDIDELRETHAHYFTSFDSLREAAEA